VQQRKALKNRGIEIPLSFSNAATFAGFRHLCEAGRIERGTAFELKSRATARHLSSALFSGRFIPVFAAIIC
jgi:hypothetical protein